MWWTTWNALAWVFTSSSGPSRDTIHGAGAFSFEGGWDVPGTTLFMPLSPKHLLFTCVGSPPPRRGTTLSLAEAAFLLLEVKEVTPSPILANRNYIYRVNNTTNHYFSADADGTWENLPFKVIYKKHTPHNYRSGWTLSHGKTKALANHKKNDDGKHI